MTAQWTNTRPWLVVYASFSSEILGAVFVVTFDFLFVLLALCFCLSAGIESSSSWFWPKLFQC